MTHRGIVIAGAGECGVSAAFALRKSGFEGRIVLLGAEASYPYERPPLSKEITSAPKQIRPPSAFEDATIDLRLGTNVEAIEVDKKRVRLSGSDLIEYDKLLLATGARERLFPGLEGCLTLRTDEDTKEISAHFKPQAQIGIVGGGFIGLELAASARLAGAVVTVFEAAPQLLARAVPSEISKMVHDRHLAERVVVKTSTPVALADANSVTLDDGSAFEFDAVIAGVGAVPNTELAEAAGLAVDNGILVDGDFRTSDPHIFAAGDCCNFEWRGQRIRLESWRAAQDQGGHVAAAILGAKDPYTKVPWFWSDQYELTLQVAGCFNQSHPIWERTGGPDTKLVFQCDSNSRLLAVAGVGPGNAVAKDLRVLEKLIERDAVIDPDVLIDAKTNLKNLLKAV